MGMSIDEAIKQLETYTIPCGKYKVAYDLAVETMRKYQNIEQILDIEPTLTIPNHPTNGDMIQKFIPIEDIWRTYHFGHGKQVCVRFKHTEYVTCFEESYWDAPYKAEVEPRESER